MSQATGDEEFRPLDITEQDVYEAMAEIPGYLDITPADFKEIYLAAYRHAIDRIFRSARAADIMTTQVIAVRGDAPLRDVAELMAKHRVSGLPVIDDQKRVIGVISEKDFFSRLGVPGPKTPMDIVGTLLSHGGCSAVSLVGQTAADIMSTPALTVNPATPLLGIVGLFRSKNVNRVPVIDDAGRLCGIVSRGDIVRLLGFRG